MTDRYGDPCACGRALARRDTGRCEMCTAIPLELQGRDTRYHRPHSRCARGAALVLPRLRIRGYCLECALIVTMGDLVTDAEVTEDEALANVRQVFDTAQITEGTN